MKHTSCILFFLAVAGLLLTCTESFALRYYWGRHPGHERVVVQFENDLPDASFKRTGRQEITLTLPADIWTREVKPKPGESPDFSGAELLEDVTLSNTKVVIRTRTSGFGYLFFTIKGQNKMVVDIFADPLGAKWSPEDSAARIESSEEETEEEAEPAGPAPEEEEPGKEEEKEAETEDRAGLQEEVLTAEPAPETDVDLLPEVGHEVRARLQSGQGKNETIPGKEIKKETPPRPPEKDAKASAQPRQEIPGQSPGTTLDYAGLYTSAQAALANGEYDSAINILEMVTSRQDVPEEIMSKALFSLADAYFNYYRDDLQKNFYKILSAYQKAMNYNPDSPEVPRSLLAIGVLQLEAGNEPEARAYFKLLEKRYPNHPVVPQVHYYWGKHYLQTKDYANAADKFQIVVDKYPESEIIKPSAVGLATALRHLGLYDQAMEIIKYVESRWPRYYIEEPAFLRVEGFVAMQLEDYDLAREKYWINYNLDPAAEGADLALVRIGDIYLKTGRTSTAREIYEMAVAKYSTKEGGLIAKMRLAEEGVFDEPSITDMFTVFDRPLNLRPKEVYSQISQNYPDSPLASVAQLKLAMWHLYNNRHQEAIDAVSEFSKRFPTSDLTSNAYDVGARAFGRLITQEAYQNDYDTIFQLWQKYDFLKSAAGSMDVQSRMLLALSLWKNGQGDKALSIVEPVAKGKYDDQTKGEALDLLLSMYVDQQEWEKVLAEGRKADKENLPQDQRSRINYSLALALENLGKEKQSHPMWEKLAIDPSLTDTQKGHAYYYLAKHAYSRNDYAKVDTLAQQALSSFLVTGQDRNKIKESLDLLIDVSDKTGRPIEALRWAAEYEKWIQENDPDWAAFQYRVAKIYRKAGKIDVWRRMMEEIIAKKSGTLYSRMAKSDLDAYELEQRAEEFQ